jgi:membrane protein
MDGLVRAGYARRGVSRRLTSVTNRELTIGTLRRLIAHDAMGVAGEAAFNFVMSLAPSLIVLVALTSVVGLSEASVTFLVTQFAALLPPGSLPIVDETVRAALANPAKGLLTTSVLFTILSGSRVLGTFTKALNRAYGCRGTALSFWRDRLIAPLMLLLVSVPVAGAAVALIFGRALLARLAVYLDLGFWTLLFYQLVHWLFVFGFVITVVALTYVVLPNTRVRLRDALPGAVVATALWALASLAFGQFASSRFAQYRLYGSLASVVVFLLWLYLSALSFLVGAELNAELASAARRDVAVEEPEAAIGI